MVESSTLDTLFMALADSTRRSILEQVAKAEMSIGEIARQYKLTFAAVSKHIKVLERANLITKRRRGKEQVVIIVPSTLGVAREHIERYATMWNDRFNNLEALLKEEHHGQN
jgi:DNA-binding transcriptional ArsR family regulator